MNAITTLHGPRIGLISAQANADLWVMLGHCDGTIARLEDQLNEQATASPRYRSLSDELGIWRGERDRIEDELKQRFLSWCGGVDLNAFVARLG